MYTVSEGSLLDDTGCVIQTQYVDVSGQCDRTLNLPLRKACKQRYALETHNALKISQPKVFRGQGESLIQDSWEGRAEKRSENHHNQLDPAERKRLNAKTNCCNEAIRTGRRRQHKNRANGSEKQLISTVHAGFSVSRNKPQVWKRKLGAQP